MRDWKLFRWRVNMSLPVIQYLLCLYLEYEFIEKNKHWVKMHGLQTNLFDLALKQVLFPFGSDLSSG